jgi:hypothetical protein
LLAPVVALISLGFLPCAFASRAAARFWFSSPSMFRC